MSTVSATAAHANKFSKIVSSSAHVEDLHVVEPRLAALLKEARGFERYWCEQLESAKPVQFPTRFFRPTENKSPTCLPTKNLHCIDQDILTQILANANLKISPTDALLFLVVDLIHRISNFSVSQYWVKLSTAELEKRLDGKFDVLSSSPVFCFARPDSKHDGVTSTLRRLNFDLQEQKLQFTFRRDILTRCKLNSVPEYLLSAEMTMAEFGQIFANINWQYLMHFQNGISIGIGIGNSGGLMLGSMIKERNAIDQIQLDLIGEDILDLAKAIINEPGDGLNTLACTFVPSAQLAHLEKVVQSFEFIQPKFIMETGRIGISSMDLGGGRGSGVNIYAVIQPEIKTRLLKFPTFPEMETWEQEFDKIYENLSEENLYAGWTKLGQPTPKAEMDEWLQHTMDSIKVLNPQVILEIGVGSGLILREIAPNCEEYVAIDISRKSIEFNQKYVDKNNLSDKVSLKKRDAAEIFDSEEQEQGIYNTIIINSVIQYFPNADHLLKTLEGALRAAKPGARIFVGDIRNKALANNWAADIEIETIHEECSIATFQENVKYSVAGDKEFCVDPDFFRLFAQKHGNVVHHVVFQLRRGKYHNEMTKFRYDAILYLKGPGITDGKKEVEKVNWSELDKSSVSLENILAASKFDGYVIREIPNARISSSILALNLNPDRPKSYFKEEFKLARSTFKDPGVDPEDFIVIGERHGFKARIMPCRNFAECFDVLFFKNKDLYFDDNIEEINDQTYEDFTNNPVESLNIQQIYGEFIIHLNKSLEEFSIQIPHVNFVKDLTSRELIF